jgi:hypothetical protein
MQNHFNIGKKQLINPFDNVKYVVVATLNTSTELLYKLLNSKSVTVETRKINEQFVILYNIELLDFTTLMTWFDTERGKFTMKGKSNHGYTPLHSIHFRIENDIMYCW